MRIDKHIFIVAAVLVLTGCGAKKKVAESVPQLPAWHTCLIRGARASIVQDGQNLSANVTMQTVRDSMLVISVMPMPGMEMMRLEATPTGLTVINKMQAQYVKGTFADVNKILRPDLNWDILQQLCTAELPTGNRNARLQYMFGEETIELIIQYPERQLDVPVNMTRLRLDRYSEWKISDFLR